MSLYYLRHTSFPMKWSSFLLFWIAQDSSFGHLANTVMNGSKIPIDHDFKSICD